MSSSTSSHYSLPTASSVINDPSIEKLWMLKAADQMMVHFNLISSVPPRRLKLSKKDDLIYHQFREDFPDFKVNLISIDDLKSNEAKAKWRSFCEKFKESVEDYNFATLLRLDCNQDYNEKNTLVTPRIQFLAIEIARNREGHNDIIYENNINKPVEKDENNLI